MTILNSQETQALLKERESNQVVFTFPVNDSFLEKSEEYHKNYFRNHIFGELAGEIDNIYYGNYNQDNKRILKVEFTITEQLVQDLIELENAVPEIDLHSLLMNGAVEILEPLSEEKLESLAAVEKITFMVAETSAFFNYPLAEQKVALSRRIFGYDIFANAIFEVVPELLKSPKNGLLYVRVTVRGFDKEVAKFLRKRDLLRTILADIEIDYPHYKFLTIPFNDNSINVIANSPEYVNETTYPVNYLIEVTKEDMDIQEEFSMDEVMKEYVFASIRKREVPLKYCPLAVNPLTNGVIYKVDGFIRF